MDVSSPPQSLFRPRPIAQQLDVYCHRVGYHRHACYLWRRWHGTYLLRSADWLHDELLNVPNQSLRKWVSSRQRNDGFVTLSDLAEMSALNPEQLPILAIWFPEAESLRSVQPILRWYKRATPEERAVMLRHGAPLSSLRVLPEDTRNYEWGAPATNPPWLGLVSSHPATELMVRLALRSRTNAAGLPEQALVAGIESTAPGSARWSVVELARNGVRHPD